MALSTQESSHSILGLNMSYVEVQNVSLDYPLVGLGARSLKNRLLGAATGGLISAGAPGRLGGCWEGRRDDPVCDRREAVREEVAGDRAGTGHNVILSLIQGF